MTQYLSHFICSAFLLITLSFSSWAQTGSIQGVVTTSDGQPAEWVTITISGTGKGTLTDQQGTYGIRNVEPGTYQIVASMIGLESMERSIQVQSGETATADFILKEDARRLQEVVVQANLHSYNKRIPSQTLRLNAPLLEVPQNIQIVTGSTLNDQQVISMSDGVIRNVSGAIRLEHWGDLYAQMTARGSQIQAFRNGFNVVNSFWGPLTEDMSFVDQIEFVKGPAGFMLANGDPSGLYNVVTKKPTGYNKGQATLTMGSFDLFRSTLDLDGIISKDRRLLYRINVSAQNKKSHRANEFNNRYVIAPVLSYQLDERTRLTLEYTYQRANMSDVGSFYVFSTEGYATLPRDYTSLPAGMPATNIDDHSVYINLDHQISEQWKITAQLARFDYFQQGSSMWPAAVNPDGTLLRAVSSWDARSRMTMGQVFVNGVVTTGPVRHRILGGLDMSSKEYFADWGQYHQLDSLGAEFNSYDPDYGIPVNGYPVFDFTSPVEQRANAAGGVIDQRYSAVYVQDELGWLNNRIRLTLAGRYTLVNQSQYGGEPMEAAHFTPRVGLSVSLTKESAFYALYDQAFIPQAGKLADGGEIKPITGNNMEVGIKRDWAEGKWSSTLSLYRILKNHELTADPFSPPAMGLSVELGQKMSEGVELDIRGRLAKGLNLIANYAFTDSKVTKVADGITSIEVGDIIPGFARHTVNGWLTYQISTGFLKGSGISAGLTWLGERKTYWDPSPDPSQNLPDYLKVDGGLFWGNDKLRVTANVFNILDEYLYNGSYYSWLNAYYWQSEPGRNVRLGVAYNF